MNYLLQEREPSLQDFEKEDSRREARDDDDDDEGTHEDETNNNNALPEVIISNSQKYWMRTNYMVLLFAYDAASWTNSTIYALPWKHWC